MIKLGIFGDHTTNPELVERIKTLPDVEIVGAYFNGSSEIPASLTEFSGPIDLMDQADALLILSEKKAGSDLIKLILRKSKHLFLKTMPNLNSREIKELVDLGKEAGVVSSVYNRFSDIPFFNLDKNYEKPVLINLRTSFEGQSTSYSNELLLLLTAINQLIQSSYRKIEVFGLDKPGNQLVLNLRVEYNNGSVFNLTISGRESDGVFEVFHSGGFNQFRFAEPLHSAYSGANQEFAAVSSFVSCLQHQVQSKISFDKLMAGVQMLNQVQENLHFTGIDF